MVSNQDHHALLILHAACLRRWCIFLVLYRQQLPAELYMELFCARSGRDAALDPCDSIPDFLRKPLVIDCAPLTRAEWEVAVDSNAVHLKPKKPTLNNPNPPAADAPINRVVLREPQRK
jgi:hypothetical protein